MFIKKASFVSKILLHDLVFLNLYWIRWFIESFIAPCNPKIDKIIKAISKSISEWIIYEYYLYRCYSSCWFKVFNLKTFLRNICKFPTHKYK